jgi:hypothetical protein
MGRDIDTDVRLFLGEIELEGAVSALEQNELVKNYRNENRGLSRFSLHPTTISVSLLPEAQFPSSKCPRQIVRQLERR